MRSSDMDRLIQKVLDQLNGPEMTLEEITAAMDYPENRLIEVLRFLSDNKQIVIKENKIKKK